MKKIILLLLSVFILLSCWKDDNIKDENIKGGGKIEIKNWKQFKVYTVNEYSKLPKPSKEHRTFMEKYSKKWNLVFKGINCWDFKEKGTIEYCIEKKEKFKKFLKNKKCSDFKEKEAVEYCEIIKNK